MTLATVVIGRNEGDRLILCLASLAGRTDQLIYVDSGSTDGSVQAAERTGAHVVALDMSAPFTAARARNTGVENLRNRTQVTYVQFVDGDCEVCEGWTETATAFLAQRQNVAIVAGRLRERYPDRSVWNQLADAEWDTPVGETQAVGGIAMIRMDAFTDVGGFRDDLIAGEEPEMCLRLRRAGWRIWRLDAEMALHDIAMTRFSQWWKRTRRHGHAVAEGAMLHGHGPERYCVQPMRRALFWGAAIPVASVVGLLITPLSLALLAAWPAQVLRLRLRGETWVRAFFLVLGKLPEAQGIMAYHIARRTRRQAEIIEYK